MSVKRIVIDASTALKQRFREEEAVAQADALFDDHARGALDLIVPPLLWFYTGDRRLVNALSARLPWVKWLGEYQLDAIPEPGA